MSAITIDNRARLNTQALLLLGAAGLLLLGLIMRLPALDFQYDPANPRSPQEQFNDFAFARFAYSDMLALFYRDGLADQPRPYLDYRYEYPAGMAGFTYLLSFVGDPRAYYLLSYTILALCALGCVALIARAPGSRPAILALAPALAVHVGVNWDVLALLPALGALLLARRGRYGWAGLALGYAVWAKVFPIFLLPPLATALLVERRWRDLARMLGSLVAFSALLNVPLILANAREWSFFLSFQRERRPEVNLWTITSFSNEQINDLFLVALVLATLALCGIVLWRGNDGAALERAIVAGAALLVWNFAASKVYSPQYGLWVLAFMALLSAPWPLSAAFWAIDAVYFLFSFQMLALVPYTDVATWFYERQLIPAMVVREAALLLIVGWLGWRALRKEQIDARAT